MTEIDREIMDVDRDMSGLASMFLIVCGTINGIALSVLFYMAI